MYHEPFSSFFSFSYFQDSSLRLSPCSPFFFSLSLFHTYKRKKRKKQKNLKRRRRNRLDVEGIKNLLPIFFSFFLSRLFLSLSLHFSPCQKHHPPRSMNLVVRGVPVVLQHRHHDGDAPEGTARSCPSRRASLGLRLGLVRPLPHAVLARRGPRVGERCVSLASTRLTDDVTASLNFSSPARIGMLSPTTRVDQARRRPPSGRRARPSARRPWPPSPAAARPCCRPPARWGTSARPACRPARTRPTRPRACGRWRPSGGSPSSSRAAPARR